MLAPALIMFAISLLCIVTGVRHLAEKGYLFNNAWMWASDTERRKLDENRALKRIYYRQSGIVFLILAVMWLLIGLSVLLESSVPMAFSYISVTSAVIFAVLSQRAIEKRKRKDSNDRK